MKIAVLSDIHGNSIALSAVLKEIKDAGIRHILVLGDIVGYYYHPDEVLKQLESFETTMIRGNHETLLEEAQGNSEIEERLHIRYGSGISEALKKLSPAQIDTLLSLPEKRSVEISGMAFLLCHGSPSKNDEYVYPDADEQKLKECAIEGVDMVLMGHTHYPMLKAVGKTTLLNPGSVGQPRDIGSSASWAIIDTVGRSAELRRTPFDAGSVVNEVRAIDPQNLYLAEVLLRKRT